MQKFDRILDRHDVISLDLVDAIDDRGQRRAFSRTGRAGQQNDAIADLGNVLEGFGQPQRVKTRYLMRNDTHYYRVGISLLKDVDAKTALAGNGVTKVGGPIF